MCSWTNRHDYGMITIEKKNEKANSCHLLMIMHLKLIAKIINPS